MAPIGQVSQPNRGIRGRHLAGMEWLHGSITRGVRRALESREDCRFRPRDGAVFVRRCASFERHIDIASRIERTNRFIGQTGKSNSHVLSNPKPAPGRTGSVPAMQAPLPEGRARRIAGASSGWIRAGQFGSMGR